MFIFVCAIRKWSSLILLHVALQFSQYYLWKRLSLSCCVFLPFLSWVNRWYEHQFISGLSVLFHWYIFPFCFFKCWAAHPTACGSSRARTWALAETTCSCAVGHRGSPIFPSLCQYYTVLTTFKMFWSHHETISFILLSQNRFGYSRSFLFPYEF